MMNQFQISQQKCSCWVDGLKIGLKQLKEQEMLIGQERIIVKSKTWLVAPYQEM